VLQDCLSVCLSDRQFLILASINAMLLESGASSPAHTANEENYERLLDQTKSFKDAMKGQGVKASLPFNPTQ